VPLIALLLSPRGAVGRRDFWLGLFLLAAIDAAMGLAAMPHGARAFFAAPVLGPWFGDMDADSALPGLVEVWGTGAVMMLFQGWISGVLCLKRLRDMGRTPWILVAVWLLNLALQGGGRVWMAGLDGMAVIVPFFVALPTIAIVWLVFLAWLGLAPSRASRRVKPQAGLNPCHDAHFT
jgi:uncharacterized membrane protein YhaH (DUF805 family)